jgi:hypothetical protein
MSKFWDMVDANTKAEAKDFIERIKLNEIVKRVLPNVSIDFPLDKAFKSFEALAKSEEHREIMNSYYKAGDEGKK